MLSWRTVEPNKENIQTKLDQVQGLHMYNKIDWICISAFSLSFQGDLAADLDGCSELEAKEN